MASEASTISSEDPRGVGAALLKGSHTHDGFTRLWQEQMLEYSAGAVILKPKDEVGYLTCRKLVRLTPLGATRGRVPESGLREVTLASIRRLETAAWFGS
jgi:hypothetical protein